MQKAKRSLNTSIHPTRPSKGIPGIPAARPSKGIPDIPDIPVIHDIQPLQAILHVPIPPGFPPHYSILQLECIFYTSTGFHKNSTEYQLRHYKHSTNFHSSKKGRCYDMGHVEDVKSIVDTPKGCNAIFVEGVESGYYRLVK